MKNKEYTDSVDKQNYPDDAIVPLDDPFKDERGYIQNLLNCSINGAAIITSKKDSVRSNHWHKEDFHYLYVLSGSMQYLERSVLSSSGKWEKDFVVKTGQMVFTPPMAIHKTIFLEDTVLISFSKRNRDHNSHEEDVMRIMEI